MKPLQITILKQSLDFSKTIKISKFSVLATKCVFKACLNGFLAAILSNIKMD